MQETWVRSLEMEMATHSVFLPGKLYGQERGGLQSTGSQKVRHKWALNAESHYNVNLCIEFHCSTLRLKLSAVHLVPKQHYLK